jgi:hypothetical protein
VLGLAGDLEALADGDKYQGAMLPSALIAIRPGDGMYKCSQFVLFEAAIVVLIGTGKLLLEESEYLLLRHVLGSRNRSHVIL